MELIKEIFNHSISKSFIEICEEVAKQNPTQINNGLGINYSENEIESIKIYYGFHHKLSLSHINALHLFGKTNKFLELSSLLIDSDYNWHPFIPTGVSFALKVDKNFNFSIGHFIMPKITQDDSFFNLDPIKNYYINHSQLPVFERKGIFTLINEDGDEHFKDYFYVHNPILKNAIGKGFNIDLSIVPSVEWVLGKGFYKDSSSNDEKIVLQSNYKEVYNTIILKEPWEIIKRMNNYMFSNFNAYCVCPGLYKHQKIKSYYYFNGSLKSPTIIDTIKVIQNGLNF